MLQNKKHDFGNWPFSALVLGVSLTLVCTGCHKLGMSSRINRHAATEQFSPPTFQTFVSPRFRSHRPNRILLVPSGAGNGDYRTPERLITELAAQIRGYGLFEVITPDKRLYSSPDSIQYGSFDEREVATLSRMHGVDAIAVVRVNDLQVHNGMRASVSLAVIDSAETVVTFEIDGTWDTANMATHKQFENFVAKNTGVKNQSLHMRSPTQLFAFVASQIVDELR
ncbi:MAG: hypothetical protein AB8B55_00180 [Mariniblastus sp.]